MIKRKTNRMNIILKKCARYYVPFGRIIVGAYFIMAGLPKLVNLGYTANMIASAGLPLPELLALATALLELGAGIAILINRYATYAALLLAGFVLIVSVPFHGPALWDGSQMGMMQQYTFMKNMALMGALLFMAAHLNVNSCPPPPPSRNFEE